MNYFFLGGRFRLQYAYVDLPLNDHYLADSIFFRHKVPVRFGPEAMRDGDKYRIVFCKVRRKYKAEFEKALSEISNKMCLLGHTDYDAYCADVQQMLKKAKAERLQRKTMPVKDGEASCC